MGWSYLGIAYLQLGLEKKSQNLMDEGLGYHRNAVNYGPTERTPLVNYALALAKMGYTDIALSEFQKGTKLFPDDVDFWCRRCHFELQSQLIDEAGDSISRILELASKTPIIPVEFIYTGGSPLPLGSAIGITVYKLDDGMYICEGSYFDIYGTGLSFKEAFIDFFGEFEILIEEYVDTDDPLDEGAQELAANLQDLIGGNISAV